MTVTMLPTGLNADDDVWAAITAALGMPPAKTRSRRTYAHRVVIGHTSCTVAPAIAAASALADPGAEPQDAACPKVLSPNHRVDATGSRRRLQALAYMGWPSHVLSEQLGFGNGGVWHLMSQRRAKVRVSTAARIADLYDRLSMASGPSEAATQRAVKAGWFSALAWDDDELDDPAATPRAHATGDYTSDWVKVMRAAEGEAIDLTTEELSAAVKVLHGQGFCDPDVAARLRVAIRTVQRHRGRMNLAANTVFTRAGNAA